MSEQDQIHIICAHFEQVCKICRPIKINGLEARPIRDDAERMKKNIVKDFIDVRFNISVLERATLEVILNKIKFKKQTSTSIKFKELKMN